MSRVVAGQLNCRGYGEGWKPDALELTERLRSFGSAKGAEPQDDTFLLSNAIREVARQRYRIRE